MTPSQAYHFHALAQLIRWHTFVPAIAAVEDAMIRLDWQAIIESVTSAIKTERSPFFAGQLRGWLAEAQLLDLEIAA